VTTRCTTCSTGVTSSGCAASNKRSAIGSESTRCRTGTCGMTRSSRCAAVCDIRRAPHDGQNPRALAVEGQQFVGAALDAAKSQVAVRQDATLEEGVELLFDEVGQFGPGAGFGVGDEAGRVLLQQALQSGQLRAVALVVDRGVIGRPLRLPADGLHDGLPWW